MEIKGFKNVLAIVNNEIVRTNIIIENGIIKSIGNDIVDGMITLDDNQILAPGFIDEHIHGAGGSDAMDGTIKDLEIISNALVKEGTTAFLATTMTQSVENIDNALRNVKEYIGLNKKNGAKVLGVHLEGPYISPSFIGAQPLEYVQSPSIESFKHYNGVSGNNIKLVSLAPEVDGALDLIKYLSSINVVSSLGHTNSTYNDCLSAVNAGATCVTHTYNAQKPLHHRDIGTVGSAFLFDELNAEAICDGIHLSAPAIKLLHKNKPNTKFTLITDAMRAKGLADGVSELGGQVVIVKNGEARLENGTLAGSVLLMNKAVKNVMNFLDIPLVEAIKYATINPAINLSVDKMYGSIECGKYANFVVIDSDVNVYATYREGIEVYKK